MKQNRWFVTLILLTTLACVVPGLSTDSPQTNPTPDTRLENMVALTVSAALEMTQQAVPTETSLPTQTAISTVTSTPEADSSGSTLVKNNDGSATFIDERGKYQVTVSGELMAMRINQQEFLDAWLLPEASNPAVQRSLSSIQNQDPEVFRLFAFDFKEEHIDGGFVTNVNFLWDAGEELSLEDETGLIAVADSYTESLLDAEILTTELVTLDNGIIIGIISSRTPATTLDDVEIVVFQKQAFFDLPTGTLITTLSTTETWQETIEPLFDETLESFNLTD
jgi:hypothetical protein